MHVALQWPAAGLGGRPEEEVGQVREPGAGDVVPDPGQADVGAGGGLGITAIKTKGRMIFSNVEKIDSAFTRPLQGQSNILP